MLDPLEERFKRFAESEQNRFPNRNANYWNRYSALVDFLRTSIYPHINAGLACLSKSPGIYTDHGGDHFDEVVRYAGELIEPSFDDKGSGPVLPYDLFLLLAGIRLHDAGNIDGREQHERRVFVLLKEAGAAVCPDDDEGALIAKIAEAHGGKTDDGSKDTIGQLPESSGMGPIHFKPRMVAALVRFADEICEHSGRASSHHLGAGTLPVGNQLFHLYAKAVKQASLDRKSKSFTLRLVFDAEALKKRYPVLGNNSGAPVEKYAIDEALDRIEKLDAERIYCNRFLDPSLRTERLHVSIEVTRERRVGGQHIPETVVERKFSIEERGYPSPDTSWRAALIDISGEKLADKLQGDASGRQSV